MKINKYQHLIPRWTAGGATVAKKHWWHHRSLQQKIRKKSDDVIIDSFIQATPGVYLSVHFEFAQYLNYIFKKNKNQNLYIHIYINTCIISMTRQQPLN